MRESIGRAAAGGIGFWLLVDLLRVWAPSLITIFGQAASTPAEVMGAFALAVVLAGVLPLLVVRFTPVGAEVVLAVTLVGALVCRAVLQLVGGGAPQLWWASAGVACAVAWSCLAARCLGDRLVEGYAVGLALAATTHAALGTWGAVWRNDVWAWLLLLVQVGLVVVALRGMEGEGARRGEGDGAPEGGRGEPRAAARGLAFALLPSYLLAGIWAASPARASVADETWGPVLVAVAAVVAVGFARAGALGRVPTVVAGVVLVAGTAGALLPATASGWSLLGYATGLPALVVVLNGLGARAPAASRYAPLFAAAVGAVLWIVLFFAYYAGYDLGYRADWLLVVLAAALSAGAVLATPGAPAADGRPPSARAPGAVGRSGPLLGAGAAVGAAVLAALVGPGVTVHAVHEPADGDEGLTVVAWNLRMGYGMDGTFAPGAVAQLIADERPDVVLLSEVDRGWLLNGGQDQLQVLARLLDMEAYFGPAADPVWGDAVLTAYPVTRVDAHPLPSYGAVTGAQALAVTVTRGGQEYEVVSTHVQPHPTEGDEDGALAQARDIAEFTRSRVESGAHAVLGGDFNLEPGEPSWEAVVGTGLHDALAGVRPVPTSSADDPEKEIDHVFVSDGLATTAAYAVPTLLSDHLPVVVTLEPAG